MQSEIAKIRQEWTFSKGSLGADVSALNCRVSANGHHFMSESVKICTGEGSNLQPPGSKPGTLSVELPVHLANAN